MLGVLLATGLYEIRLRGAPIGGMSDFDQVWFAARTLLDGGDPYRIIQPGGPQGTDYPFYYPLTSAVLALPLGVLSLDAARWIFLALGLGVLGYGIGRSRPWLWPILFSVPLGNALLSTQWSPLLTGAMLLPSVGFLAAAKPNLGLVMLVRSDSRRSARFLIVGGFAVLAASLVADPRWPVKWFEALRGAPHFAPLITRPLGFLMLAGLWRWRDPEARMLVALSLVPQTGLFYEALPAMTVARTRLQALALTLMTHAGWYLGDRVVTGHPDFAARSWVNGIVVLYAALFPALALVLWRERGAAGRWGGRQQQRDSE